MFIFLLFIFVLDSFSVTYSFLAVTASLITCFINYPVDYLPLIRPMVILWSRVSSTLVNLFLSPLVAPTLTFLTFYTELTLTLKPTNRVPNALNILLLNILLPPWHPSQIYEAAFILNIHIPKHPQCTFIHNSLYGVPRTTSLRGVNLAESQACSSQVPGGRRVHLARP